MRRESAHWAGVHSPRRRWSSAPCSALARKWPDRLVGLVLAFGAGALISAVSFDLAEDGAKVGGGTAVRSASRPGR